MAEAKLVRFGTFEADVASGDLRRQGLKVRLRGRPFDVLAVLLERPGQLVSREELRERLWPADTFVDFDHGMNTAVNRLREALGDSAENPRFIETVPRRGYRFIAPVTAPAPGAPEEATAGALPAAGATAPARADAAPGAAAGVAAAAPADAAAGAAQGAAAGVATAGTAAARLAIPARRSGRRAVAGAVVAGLALLVAYRWVAPARSPSRLAVLPFQNLSGDPSQEYFADGLTEALIANLARLRALRVISRTSVMPYKTRPKPLPEIAKELGVDAVVEGSVLRSGSRVRITAQLIDARADRHLWAETYERDVADILGLQGEVAQAIAQAVRVAVTPQEQERLSRTASVDPRAYEAYLRGRFFWSTMTSDGFEKSVDYLQQAIALDPGYAPAYAALADSYWVMGTSGFEMRPPREVEALARAAALKALSLDADEAAAHAALGEIAVDHDWNWEEGEAHFRRAIELNPSLSSAHVSYSGLLAGLGRFAESVAEARRGLELDPLSVVAGQTLGFRLFYAGVYDRAILQFRKTLELDPHAFVARAGLAQGLWATGDRRQALAEAERAVAASGGNSWVLAWLGYAKGAMGDARQAREILAQLEASGRTRYVSPIYPAIVHAGLGDRDKALAALEQACDAHSPWMLFLNVEPEFDALRNDPRFVKLLRRVGHRPASEKAQAPAAGAS